MNISAIERAAGLRYREQFLTPQLAQKNGVSKEGTVSFVDGGGILYPGAASDLIKVNINGKNLFANGFTLCLEVTPGFLKNDGVDRRPIAGLHAAAQFILRKTTADTLSFYVDGTAAFSVAYAVWAPYWVDGQKNIIIISSESGATNVWINGTYIGVSAATYGVQQETDYLYLGSTSISTSPCPNTTFHRFEIYQGLATTEDEAVIREGTLVSDILPDSSLITLPLERDYQGSDGVELLVDADCQAYTTDAWGETGTMTSSKVTDSATGVRALHLVKDGGGAIWVTQTILAASTPYRVRGEFRCNGGTVVPSIFLGSATVATGIGAGVTGWVSFDVVATSSGGATQVFFGGGSMVVNDWVEYRNFSVEEVKQITPAIGQASVRRLGPNLLVDGDMEKAGVADWTIGDAVAIKETTSPLVGSRCLRITATVQAGAQYPQAYQGVITADCQYRVTGYARSDGTEIPRVALGVSVWIGTTSTDWQYFEVIGTATTGVVALFCALTDPVGTEYIEFDQVSVREVISSGAKPLIGDGLTTSTFPTKLNRPHGYSFDGGDYITIPDSDNLSMIDGSGDVPFSVGIRFVLDVLSGTQYVIGKSGGLTSGEYLLSVSPTGALSFGLVDDDNSGYIYIYGSPIATWGVVAGKVMSVIGTYDGSQADTGLSLYFDGVPIAVTRTTLTYTQMRNTSKNLYVGARDALFPITGNINFLQITKGVCFSPTQVKAFAKQMELEVAQ